MSVLVPRRPLVSALALSLLLACGAAFAQSAGENEPNIAVPATSTVYRATEMPDRIVATPAADAATGFAVNWRTNTQVQAPLLEIVVAGDSPDVGTPRQLRATTTPLVYRDTVANTHRVDIDGLQPDTLYMFRVQGQDSWSAWRQLRTTGAVGEPFTLLYFGDTQNKNVSHVSRVVREAMRHAPDASMAVFAGDLIGGGDDVNDIEWGEWFQAIGDLPDVMLVAPALGNHEYFEEFEDTPHERRVLAAHWPRTFALPSNGASHEHTTKTTYWFDANGVRVVVLDGTSALDLDSAQAQAQWLDRVLTGNPNRWTLTLIHQPIYSPRGRGASDTLRAALQPVLERHAVDLMLQGHDHTYGRRAGDAPGAVLPQYIVSVTGPKQYRLSDEAKRTMDPTAEDTQLFQVLRIDGDKLYYEARTATGRLYDAFQINRDAQGRKTLTEIRAGRIPERNCSHRDATLGGRSDRCWE